MESLKELYRIGPGPSSSHTLGVRNACLYYLNKYPNKDKYYVELCGSLALTGIGHGTDKIVLKSFGEDKVVIKFEEKIMDEHPNTMHFSVFENGKKEYTTTIYSVGGGAIRVKGEPDLVDGHVYPEESFSEIKKICDERLYTLAEYVYYREPNLKMYLVAVARAMIEVIDNGIKEQGTLPGPLKLKKVAKELYQEYQDCNDLSVKQKLLLSAYAYAAMEENACGGMVVTAPTLGSCGIVSAMVHYYYDKGVSMEQLANGLAVGGIFGNLIKTNATISGAAGGCQAEVGTACVMASALASYLEGLSTEKIEIAAEIAMEHNLGLTCDPVGGYVQVPCIERNGVGVLRSIDSMLYAKYLGPLKKSKVSFDMIVQTMNYTGKKIAMELKETSLGGLAEVVPLTK